MKTKYKILIGAFVVLVILFGLDKCGQSKKLLRVEGEKKVLERQLVEQTEMSMDTIAEKESIITKQDAKIEGLLVTIADKNRELASGATEITEVEEAYDDTAPESEQIENLKNQVSLWKNQFRIATEIIAEKDEIIFSLISKYDSQVSISNEYKGLYESTLELNETLDFQIKLLKRKAVRLKLGGQVKSTIILGVIGLIVYSVVK